MRACLVTGCGKGIGRDFIERHLIRTNDIVIGIYRSEVDDYECLLRWESRLLFVKGDVKDEDIFEKVMKLSKEKFGILPSKFVINAGMRLRNALECVDKTQIEDIWRTNYFQLRNVVKCMIANDLMESNLVYVSSIVSQRGFVDLDDYGATKAAAESLIRSIAVRFPEGCFNSISPGFTKTSYADSFMEKRRNLYEWTVSRAPKNRWGESHEISEIISCMMDASFSYMTGQNIVVDGGWLANA